MVPHSSTNETRLAVLDGWRGISILLVMACHLLPLGPKSLDLNSMAGPMGMAIFFTLSGFLITRFLLTHSSISDFLIRRLFRIVPLAWIGISVALWLGGSPSDAYLPNFLFYANLPPQHIPAVGSHLWSLCVEMQFYIGIALLVGILGKRGLYLVPLLCVAVTVHRVFSGAHTDIVTWRRGDEILAGSMLAMAFEGKFGTRPVQWIKWLNAYVLLLLLAVCSHPASGFMNYFRPYVGAMLVGVTLYSAPLRLDRMLKSRALAYVANISYALYVIHPFLTHTWLFTGDKLVKYAKRPLLFATAFLLAHMSTFHFEKHWIALGKRLTTSERNRLAGKSAL